MTCKCLDKLLVAVELSSQSLEFEVLCENDSVQLAKYSGAQLALDRLQEHLKQQLKEKND